MLHALQIVGENSVGELAHVRLFRAGVERIGRVRHNFINAVFRTESMEGGDIAFLNRLG